MIAQPKASHFVDGAYVEDTAGAVIEVIYPATGAVIARLHEATPAVIEAALASATRAQTAWAALRPVDRARILRRAADIIRDRNADLARLETLDTGKPLQETLVADWPSGADALEYFAGLAPTITGRLYHPRGFGGLRRHRRLELPQPDCLLEIGSGAGFGQCHGVQTF